MSKAAAPVDRSRLRLSEVARHVVIPEGIVDTLWFEVADRCEEFGDSFDVWQDGLGQAALGIREDGTFAATVGGITMSIPRQVAKTFMVGRIVVALCTMFPDLTVVWTAHRSRTATNTFQKLKGFVMRSAVRPYLKPGRNEGTAIRDANGEQEIPFLNGSVITFGAREQGFGRGWDEVDVEVFDEAQILTIKALEDMVAATNQSRFVHGALLFYMGTPPRPVDPGEVFTSRRTEALEAKEGLPDFGAPTESGDSMYVECSADENVGRPDGPSLDDRRQVEKANPSYPVRTPEISVARLRKNLPDNDAWRREGLGVWDDKTAAVSRLISANVWQQQAVTSVPDGVRSLGVAFSASGERMAVCGALKHDDGVHVEPIDVHCGPIDQGTAKLARWIADRHSSFARITMSGRSHATVLYEALRKLRVPAAALHVASTTEYFTACAMLPDGVMDGTVTHPDAPEDDVLEASIAVCDKKIRGKSGAWGWVATSPDGDETPAEAASLALWGARTSKRQPGRKQVLL